MPCCLFDGVDSYLRFGTLSSAMQDVATGAYTFACLFKRNASPSFAGLAHLLENLADWTTMNMSMETQSSTIISAAQADGNNLNMTVAHTVNVNHLVVVSKAAGTTAPVGQVKTIGGSWTSPATAASSAANSPDDMTSGGKLVVGAWILNSTITDPFPGRIGLMAFWNGVNMDQTQREACGTNEKTSDLWNHSVGRPTSLMEITNVTTITDLGGGCVYEANVNGVVDDSDNLGWNFDGTGASGVIDTFQAIPFMR